MGEELRRVDDQRFEELKRELKSDIRAVASDVSSIRDMLISEPEASPMGRALIRRSEVNASATRELRRDFEDFEKERFNPVYDWWNQQKGSWKALQGLALVLGVIGAFFGILAYWGVRPTP